MIEHSPRFGDMLRARPACFETGDVVVDVLADWRRQMIGDPVFGSGKDLGSHLLGSTLQVGENALSRGLVSASGRDFDDESVAVAVACNIR